MRRAASLAGAVLLAAAAAGCGGSHPRHDRSLDAFFARTAVGRTLGTRFPHRPGSVACTVFDHQLQKRVAATCATDVSDDPTRVVVTFTESWSHGSRTHTWFVFLHLDGTIESVRQEGAAPNG